MRRHKAAKRGRWFGLLLAGVVGFLIGDWHATVSRPTGLSATENVALRFPETSDRAAVADDGSETARAGNASLAVLGDAQRALLSPQPMVPLPQPPVPEPATTAALPHATPAAPNARPVPAKLPRAEAKAEVDGAASHANRPGFMLNDAQIASIKTRLHLTRDQEAMWPAVEAALRNVAYAKARAAHHRGAAANALAAADQDGAAVQDLKSAAIPLIMSFSDQQKNEVKSLAHVMGLDKLASDL
jgi:hypothetical protein